MISCRVMDFMSARLVAHVVEPCAKHDWVRVRERDAIQLARAVEYQRVIATHAVYAVYARAERQAEKLLMHGMRYGASMRTAQSIVLNFLVQHRPNLQF